MKFNDDEWRRRSSQRMTALHADPSFRLRLSAMTAARHRDQSFKQRRGDLTDYERSLVVSEIQSGKPPKLVAKDWLLSVGRVYHIRMEARYGINSKTRVGRRK